MRGIMREVVTHPISGERYILETTETPGGTVYRAAGPLHYSEVPNAAEMLAWLNNQPDPDAYNDGKWLAEAIGRS